MFTDWNDPMLSLLFNPMLGELPDTKGCQLNKSGQFLSAEYSWCAEDSSLILSACSSIKHYERLLIILTMGRSFFSEMIHFLKCNYLLKQLLHFGKLGLQVPLMCILQYWQGNQDNQLFPSEVIEGLNTKMGLHNLITPSSSDLPPGESPSLYEASLCR